MERVRWLRRHEVDPEWDVRELLLKDSPFRSPVWVHLWRSVGRLVKQLPASAQHCYRLSYRLFREVADVRSVRLAERRGIRHADYFAREVVPLFARTFKDAQEVIPALAGACHDVSITEYHAFQGTRYGNDVVLGEGYIPWAEDRLDVSRHEISSRLREYSDDQITDVGPKPKWDATTHSLWYDGQLLKRFTANARNQMIILSTFEDDGWPRIIDDPLTGLMDDTNRPDKLDDPYQELGKSRDRVAQAKIRLKHTVRDLQRGLDSAIDKNPPIVFATAKDKTAVCWRRSASH